MFTFERGIYSVEKYIGVCKILEKISLKRYKLLNYQTLYIMMVACEQDQVTYDNIKINKYLFFLTICDTM